jgi:predicted GIY-YIG superfamily endonuclease
MHHQVYVIENAAGRKYIGLSEDVEKRLNDHNTGVSKWTKTRGPWRLIWTSPRMDLSSARKLEIELKRQKGGAGFYRITGLQRSSSDYNPAFAGSLVQIQPPHPIYFLPRDRSIPSLARPAVRYAPEKAGLVGDLFFLEGFEGDEVNLAAEAGDDSALFVAAADAFVEARILAGVEAGICSKHGAVRFDFGLPMNVSRGIEGGDFKGAAVVQPTECADSAVHDVA